MAAAGALLWLLRELNIRPLAALAAAALAMWNPYRNEIWTSLTLAEGVAMPFALTALTCAAKAPGSRRPWLWDAAGILGVLAALGCKNTFAVLVPAQLVLRVLPDGVSWREGLRLYGRRAGVLLLPLAMPVVHYVWYKLNWHPGQYATTPPTLGFVGTFLKGIAGAVSIDFLGAGLALALLAVVVARWPGVSRTSPTRQPGQPSSWRRPVLAGLVLLVLGVGVYLPIGAVSGRYAMPAVWGVDLLIAVLLSELATAPAVWLRRAAWAAIGCGLVAAAAANVGRQEKFARRADLLWQTLEHVEQTAPPGACVAWQSGPALNIEEGIHFAWHLHARGRTDIRVRLLAEDGHDATRCELPACAQAPDYLITERAAADGSWHVAHEFTASYWAGRRRYQCYLWEKGPSPALTARRPAAAAGSW